MDDYALLKESLSIFYALQYEMWIELKKTLLSSRHSFVN